MLEWGLGEGEILWSKAEGWVKWGLPGESMILKAVAVLGGMFVVVVGGMMATKYSDHIFGTRNHEKMQIWIDENGNCRSKEEGVKDDGGESLCKKMLANKASEIDWSKVVVYWNKVKTKSEEAIDKWNNRSNS